MKKILAIVLTIIMLSLGVLTSSCKEEHVCEFKWEVVKESTCTEKGIAEFKCKNCEKTFLVELETKEHSFDVDSDGQKQTCENCGKTENVPHPHPIIAVQAKSATCGAKGMKAHYFCEYCLSYFEDEDGKKPIEKSELIIPATGNHTPGPDNFYCFDEATSKWMHDIRCDVCHGPINLDPIECPECHGEALDVVGNDATCKNQSCQHQFTI